MNFMIYDLTFLVIFTIFVSIFLYSRRKNLKREGLLFLYRTQWGVKLINYVGKKYKKTLYFFSYLIIGLGYILMISVVYLFGKIVYIYIAFPSIVRAVAVPPIMPLVPYLTSISSLSFLPPFYFTYWIIILAIVAVTHEFAHGIFMRRYNIKIKSTGFGFLGPFLAAFVEQDEKSMNKSSKFEQLSVLSAGTFANILTAILFFILLVIFFSYSFTPSGVIFDSYSYSIVPISMINSINGNNVNNITFDNLNETINEMGLSKVKVGNFSFVANRDLLNQQVNTQLSVVLYDDAPAINANLSKTILEINGVKIENVESLSTELEKYSAGEKIRIKTIQNEEVTEQEITLGKHPVTKKSWLGIGFSQRSSSGISGAIFFLISLFKEDHVYYIPNTEIATFIYDFLWWTVLISISVALVNMLPVGIFDGGRVYYLTVLYFTKNENLTKKIFTWTTYFFLFLLFLLMFFWAISFR